MILSLLQNGDVHSYREICLLPKEDPQELSYQQIEEKNFPIEQMKISTQKLNAFSNLS